MLVGFRIRNPGRINVLLNLHFIHKSVRWHALHMHFKCNILVSVKIREVSSYKTESSGYNNKWQGTKCESWMSQSDVVVVFSDISLHQFEITFGPFNVLWWLHLQVQSCPSVRGHHNTSKLRNTTCPRTERNGARNLRLQGIKYLYV